MSGMVYIMPTEFHDLTTQTRTLGFRIFNDVSHAYDNTWVDMPKDPLEIFARVIHSNDYQVMEFLDQVCDQESDVIVGGKLLKFEKLKEIIMDS